MSDKPEGLTFFRSYYEAASELPDKQRLALYDAIMQFGFDNVIPELNGIVKTAFTLIKPNLSKSKARSKAGAAGGRGKSKANDEQEESKVEANGKQTASKDEAKPEQCGKQTESKSEAHHEQTPSKLEAGLHFASTHCSSDKDKDKDKDKEEEKEKKQKKPPLPDPISERGFSPAIDAKVREWLQYKKERNDTYKPTGLSNLLSEIDNHITKYGEQAVLWVISTSMANNWQGIIWNRIEETRKRGGIGDGRNNNQPGFNPEGMAGFHSAFDRYGNGSADEQ